MTIYFRGERRRHPQSRAMTSGDYSKCSAFSALISAAGLSSRRPLNDAWRTLPSPVQPANSISATKPPVSPNAPRRWPRHQAHPRRSNGLSFASCFLTEAKAARPCRGRSRCRPCRHRRDAGLDARRRGANGSGLRSRPSRRSRLPAPRGIWISSNRHRRGRNDRARRASLRQYL